MGIEQKIKQLFKDFKPLEAKDFSMPNSTCISSYNSSPPLYIISLIINVLEFKKYKEDEKINWFTAFKFNDCIFIVHDYKFNTWSIRIGEEQFDENNKEIEKTVNKIKKLFTEAAPLVDEELKKILINKLDANNYFFNNTFDTLMSVYNFYKNLVENGFKKHSEAKIERIEKNEKYKFFTKVYETIDHKHHAAQEVAYLTFSLMGLSPKSI